MKFPSFKSAKTKLSGSAANEIRLSITMADGKPLSVLSDLIEKRIRYTNETAKQSIAACAIDILKSLRTITMKARLARAKVSLTKQDNLYPSFTKLGGRLKLCIRQRNTNTRIEGFPILNGSNGTVPKLCHVFLFVDNRGDERNKKSKSYYVIAPTEKMAIAKCKEVIKKRITKFKGLARLALGKLMQKIAYTSVNDQVSPSSVVIADKTTKVNTSTVGKAYSLTAYDNLDYALLALKGGKASLDTQLMKAANKISSVIKRKVGDDFFTPKFESPFPEVRSKT